MKEKLPKNPVTINSSHYSNALPSVRDDRDHQVIDYFAGNASVPKEFSLINDLPPVRDQGAQGACVAEAIICCKDYHERKDVNFQDSFSSQFIYNLRSNHPSEGMQIRDALDIVLKKGVCPEKYYPYLTDTSKESITEEMLNIAKNYKIKSYARINTVDELKNALIQFGPCIITFPVYNQIFPDFWNKRSFADTLTSYHCIAVVGWTKDSFIMRNSWGKIWGYAGYTYLKFSEWGKQLECWSLIDEKSERRKEDLEKPVRCCGLIF